MRRYWQLLADIAPQNKIESEAIEIMITTTVGLTSYVVCFVWNIRIPCLAFNTTVGLANSPSIPEPSVNLTHQMFEPTF